MMTMNWAAAMSPSASQRRSVPVSRGAVRWKTWCAFLVTCTEAARWLW